MDALRVDEAHRASHASGRSAALTMRVASRRYVPRCVSRWQDLSFACVHIAESPRAGIRNTGKCPMGYRPRGWRGGARRRQEGVDCAPDVTFTRRVSERGPRTIATIPDPRWCGPWIDHLTNALDRRVFICRGAPPHEEARGRSVRWRAPLSCRACGRASGGGVEDGVTFGARLHAVE